MFEFVSSVVNAIIIFFLMGLAYSFVSSTTTPKRYMRFVARIVKKVWRKVIRPAIRFVIRKGMPIARRAVMSATGIDIIN